MSEQFGLFERIARMSGELAYGADEQCDSSHPFDERNIHPDISKVSVKLFNNGHYSQATFEAFKFLDLQVKKISGIKDSGYKLMMAAFAESNPKIRLTTLSNQSEIDEQVGFKFIFAGAMSAIRNPRGHDITTDPIDRCLNHLSVASVLLRRLEERKP
ncbi:MAG: TIGR02391 family protein [Sphingomonadaceae bacterium]|nr:TIGR02391 family protein [Sphingomonadaceae bacterium]MCP5384457.1 TIGR02391 family protein [Altererythrobacter sp.]MCP5390716.1 TIGR02391 family protein [Sphingomonadaceae bacterium]MCP5393783.1 TIGR02391 family protein [Sphingomonadaceae bacterium]